MDPEKALFKWDDNSKKRTDSEGNLWEIVVVCTGMRMAKGQRRKREAVKVKGNQKENAENERIQWLTKRLHQR